MPLHHDLLTMPAPAATGPDAAIIRACNAFAALEIARHAEDFSDEEADDTHPAYAAAYRKMLAAGRATTPQGHLARARALALHIDPDVERQWHWSMVEALLEGMLALPAEDVAKAA